MFIHYPARTLKKQVKEENDFGENRNSSVRTPPHPFSLPFNTHILAESTSVIARGESLSNHESDILRERV